MFRTYAARLLRPLLLLAGALLLGFAFVAAQRDQARRELTFSEDFYSQAPLSERPSAMGASDPTWSPDGAELIFSLYGSLWRMRAEGGEARQLTAAPGYDAGPAWSPDGTRVAFVRGDAPLFGSQQGAIGTLYLLELASGAEQPLSKETRVVGSPEWTRDNAALLASVVEAGAVTLYRIPLDGGPRERVTGALASRVSTIVQRGNAWFHYWYPVALHPGGAEIAYGGDRDGTPQLWRMPLASPLYVTAKLTSFRESQQADIQGLSWEGDRSLLFSANLHSERTNLDLWRWRGGDSPVVSRLTSTIVDEYSPRLSPDRSKLVFVSNHLGNLDLFETTPELAPARHIRIGPLRFRSSGGRLRVQVRDEAGQTVAARVSVKGADGKYYTPAGVLWRYNPGMGEAAGFFHADGDFELDLPAGAARIEAIRGFEHEPATVTAAIAPGGAAQAQITLRRRFRWQGSGWWSGEDHIHANYMGPYYLRPEDALRMARAENLNVANMLAANAEGERAYDREFFEGRVSRHSEGEHILYWNEEFRNRIVYGHMALLELRRLTEPMFTSFEGTSSPWDYPSNTMAARDAKAQGATVAYVHPILGATRDPFDFTVSAKELPVTAALGYVDVLDIYPWGPGALELWYKLLNCGFRIAPGAGTDTFSNWRTLNRVPGDSRAYVASSEPLSYGSWLAGLRAGRSFVTNGPLVALEVNGERPGGVVRSEPGTPLRLKIEARVESLAPVRRIELVINGKVAASRENNGDTPWRVSLELPAAESGWIAARVSGDAQPRALGAAAQAHTAPVYLEAEGRPIRPDPEALRLMIRWIDRLWDLVELRDKFPSPAAKEEVRELVFRARAWYEGQLARPPSAD